MDFDSIISLILILLFFLFPTIIKQLSIRKETGKAAPQTATKLSLFQRLGEQIREYALNLERQARQNEQGKETGWDAFEEQPQEEFSNPFDPDRNAGETELESSPIVPVERPVLRSEKLRPAPCFVQSRVREPGLAFDIFQKEPSNRDLQQAIIWSEILSKPIALRNKSI